MRTRLAAPAVLLIASLLAASCGTPPPAVPAPPGEFVRDIAFPVFADVTYSDTFGAPRSGGRSHEGQDLMTIKMAPLLSAVDGTVTFLRHSSDGLSGNMLIITDDEGWEYVYIHLNNDLPFTDDGTNRYDLAFADGIVQGQRVKKGEFIGFVGDSGNAEWTSPHLHFEIVNPAGTAVNAYWSLMSGVRHLHLPEDTDRPSGEIDSMTREADGSLTVTGWGVHPTGSEQTPLLVYVNFNPAEGSVTRTERAEVNTEFGIDGEHGFEISGLTAPPEAEVCGILRNLEGGAHRRLDCQTVA